MMTRLLLLLALALWPDSARATITFSAASATVVDTSTASSTKTFALVSDVPAGATIVCLLFDRTDETTTFSSASDPVNGTWTSPVLTPYPADAAAGTGRAWIVRRHNSAALTGAGNRTISLTTSAGISTQVICGWMNSDLGAMTDDQNDSSFVNDASNSIDADSNALTPSSQPGVLVCGWTMNNTQSAVPTQNAGEANWNTQTGGNRAFLAYETFSATSAVNCDTDLNATASAMVFAHTFLEPASATANFYQRRFGR